MNKPINLSMVSILHFDQNHFLRPESEQSLTVCWGRKEDFSDVSAFWISALNKMAQREIIEPGYMNDYVQDSPFLLESNSGPQIKSLILDKLSGLREKKEFPLGEEILGGVILENDWDVKEVVGETEVHFFSFFWETSA